MSNYIVIREGGCLGEIARFGHSVKVSSPCTKREAGAPLKHATHARRKELLQNPIQDREAEMNDTVQRVAQAVKAQEALRRVIGELMGIAYEDLTHAERRILDIANEGLRNDEQPQTTKSQSRHGAQAENARRTQRNQ
jgi:hypothetical protein